MRTLLVVVAPLLALAACPAPPAVGEGEGEGAAAGEGEGAVAEGEGAAGEGEGEGGAAVTWYRDVLPLARQHCEVCHTAGGIGPFDMEDTDAVIGEQDNIAAMVAARIMPPWMPSSSCGGHSYVGDRSLNADEIALFTSWSGGGFAIGDINDSSGTVPTLGALDRIDATLTPSAGYIPVQGQSDDYHCFLLDPALSAQKFVTGFDIAPGTPSMVHHVLLYAVDRAAAQTKDDSTPEAGWTCFGGPEVDTNNSTVPPTVLAAWAPGTDATLYPAGTGVPLDTSQVVVMQVHYNFQAAPTPIPSDLTSAQLKLEDSVANAALLAPLADTGFSIPPGGGTDSKTFQTFGFKIYGLLPHMHQLGTHINVTLDQGAADENCLVDIPAWNFHWQQSYFFSEVDSIQTSFNQHATVTCTWDNNTGNNITWGESTSDEMCLAFAYVTR